MKYLFDTNIISEFYKPVPNPQVVAWMDGIDSALMYVSVVSIGEIRRGIEKKRIGHQYPDSINRLANSLMHMELVYAGKILPFDQKAAHIWGQITACYPNNPIDAQIASIALVNDAVLVTRDKDFIDLASKIADLGIKLRLINPFDMPH